MQSTCRSGSRIARRLLGLSIGGHDFAVFSLKFFGQALDAANIFAFQGFTQRLGFGFDASLLVRGDFVAGFFDSFFDLCYDGDYGEFAG